MFLSFVHLPLFKKNHLLHTFNIYTRLQCVHDNTKHTTKVLTHS